MTNEEKIDLKKEIEEQDGYEYSDELFFTGEGDLLDTAEGRAKFCRINETTVFRKKDPTSAANFSSASSFINSVLISTSIFSVAL